MKKYLILNIILIVNLINLVACKKEDLNKLTVSKDKIDIAADGGTASFQITTDAPAWNITHTGDDWVKLTVTNGTEPNILIPIKVSTKTANLRTDTLTITAGNATPIQIMITQAASEYIYTLSCNLSLASYTKKGGAIALEINSDATQWTIETEATWLTFDKTTGTETNATIQVTADEYNGVDARQSTILLKAEYAQPITINVKQNGSIYPSYNTYPLEPDNTGMTSTAVELATKIKVGWNLGNSLEATGGETAWGNPIITQNLIDLVYENGFNAVRLPCAWNGHLSNAAEAKINEDWLNRVKQVVQYCINNDMYVLLNIHWDGGWLENNCTPEKQEINNEKQRAFWEQIATYFRDFDEHLLFASANEPNVDNPTQMAVLKSYHQTCIDAVRSTGGKNTYRTIVIQGPATDISKTNDLMLSLPTDPTQNRMMTEIHFYTPWNFCGLEADADWGKMYYYWGEEYHSDTDPDRNATSGEENDVKTLFALMQTQFVRKGIPVVMGEYGAIRRSALTGDALTEHLASRAYYLKFVTQQAKAYGLIPFYWDNGGNDNNSFGIFNRKANTVFDQQALDALIEGAQ